MPLRSMFALLLSFLISTTAGAQERRTYKEGEITIAIRVPVCQSEAEMEAGRRLIVDKGKAAAIAYFDELAKKNECRILPDGEPIEIITLVKIVPSPSGTIGIFKIRTIRDNAIVYAPFDADFERPGFEI